MGEVARWFFRLIEHADGWACCRGRLELDRHDSLADALEHILEVAASNRPSEVVLHRASGEVQHHAVFD